MIQISNQELTLENIPDPDVHWNVWSRFTHTDNGHELQGGIKPCSDLANDGEAETLTDS